MTTGSCHVCASLGAADPGQLLYRGDRWFATTAGDVPGWVRIATLRHGDWLWDLHEDEAVALGPLVQEVSAALHKVAGAAFVYTIALGENSLHPHLLLIPRPADAPEELRGPSVLGRAAELTDAEATRRMAEALRSELGS